MSIALYDATIATYLQTLGALEGVLARGFDHCRDNAIDPQEILETRIHPDMLPFRFQVGSTISHSVGAIDAVRSGTYSPARTPELDYAGLQKAVSEARETLGKVTREEAESFIGKDTQFAFGGRSIPFLAQDILLTFSIPNFFFHSSMTYAILRAKGVPLGKRDFMGQMRIKR